VSLAEATTVDLSPWASRYSSRAAAVPRRTVAPRPAVRILLAVARWLFEVVWTVLFLAGVAVAVFVVVLAAHEAVVDLLGWRWR
jgi:hypothetical protein